MNLERLTNSIKESEGYRTLPYQDTLGFWTVGFGHLIHNEIVQHTGTLTFKELMGYYSSKTNHDAWLARDIESAIAGAKKWLGDEIWNSLTDRRREVVVEMRFQLGGRQSQFITTRSMIQAGNYAGAADSMLNSLWAKQTPQRVHRHAQHMKSG